MYFRAVEQPWNRLVGKHNMSEKINEIAYCGLYCAECPSHSGVLADLARDLRKELRTYRYDKVSQALAEISFFKDFKNYETCYRVLGLLVKMRCGHVCREGGGNPMCSIRKCCEKKGISGCWECNEFDACEKFTFLQKAHGDAMKKNISKIKRKGIDEFLAGQKYWYVKPKEENKERNR